MALRKITGTTRAHGNWENFAWSALEAIALTVIVLAGIVGVLAVAALLA